MTRASTLAPVLCVSLTALLAACSQQGSSNTQQAQSAPPPPAQAQPAQTQPAPAQAPQQSGGLRLQAVNSAQFSPAATGAGAGANASTSGAGAASAGSDAASKTPSPSLIRAEVLLDRARFSPGVIDGLNGENFQNALKAYEAAKNLPGNGQLTPQAWQALTSDSQPVLTTYTITQQDVAGPWSPDVGENMVKLSELKATGYHSPLEMLAERFHMDQNLLKALNPGVDFGKAGTRIVVAALGPSALPGAVKKIEVDKAKEQVRAYDANGNLLALYPATVGSTERPSPVGTYKVNGVSKNPDYTYDPSKLTWGPKKAGKLHIPPGPNNPVGLVWIALSAPDYGIHGSPDPRLIGKTASHGCVRLTNWDVKQLATAVKPGVKVVFLSKGQSGSDSQGGSGSGQGGSDGDQGGSDSGSGNQAQ